MVVHQVVLGQDPISRFSHLRWGLEGIKRGPTNHFEKVPPHFPPFLTLFWSFSTPPLFGVFSTFRTEKRRMDRCPSDPNLGSCRIRRSQNRGGRGVGRGIPKIRESPKWRIYKNGDPGTPKLGIYKNGDWGSTKMAIGNPRKWGLTK